MATISRSWLFSLVLQAISVGGELFRQIMSGSREIFNVSMPAATLHPSQGQLSIKHLT